MPKNFYDSVSEKYRSSGKGQLSLGEVEAYLQARMPATAAAVSHVLNEVAGRIAIPIKSLLDLGAGPGTGLLVAKEIFQDIDLATLIEKNESMIKKGKEIVDADWVNADIEEFIPTAHDLALFAYSFGEIRESSQIQALKRAWDAARILVIVEPGTPRGFSSILKAREHLIEWKGQMIAPCPHMKKCPMQGEKWCHFSVRLERTREHRQLKGGKLGWEDEKFSYVAFSKDPIECAEARIIGHPHIRTGNVALQLCTNEGLLEKTISKKERTLYKIGRKAKWGDPFKRQSLRSKHIIEESDDHSSYKPMDKCPDGANNRTND